MNFRFVDLFCGGGGSITGAINALCAAGITYEGRGFNHWDVAIQTIKANHPEVVPNFERACAPIESVLPDEIFQSDPTRIDVVWASPACTHHSIAAGGKPKSNQLRSQPEYLLPYLRLTRCRRMFIENVRELQKWGPLLDKDLFWHGKLHKAGTPDPRKEGLFFNLWYREIKASGYHVDMQMMNAADYGAATSRERLIVQAVRKSSGERIVWPEPTHLAEPGIFAGQCKPWRTAAEIIDWGIPGVSIFGRKVPLKPNTLRRIEAGIKKYWGAWAEPFLIVLRGTKERQIPCTAVSLNKPLPTLCANGGHIALIRPFITRYNGGDNRNHGIQQPIPVIDCSNRYGIIEPMIVPYKFSNQAKSANQPIDTITTVNNFSLVQPLFIPQQSCGTCKPINTPLSTISTSGAIGLVEPLIIKYYGNGSGAKTIHAPLDTIMTKDHFGLIQGRILTMPDGQQFQLDITHRMLTADELALATSFPKGYVFCGGDTAAKKQIGNAVPPVLAEALYRAVLAS